MPAGVVKWTATINNTSVDLIEVGNVEYEFWTPGRFQITVPNDADHRSLLLGSNGYAGAGKEVRLYREVNNGGQTLMMKGPVYRVRVDNTRIQVEGYGKGIELARSYTGDNVYFLDYPSTKVISHILIGTDFTLGETGSNPPDISCRFYTENKWRALMDTVKNFTGWEARIEPDDTITYKKTIGVDRSASFTMQYGYNVVSDGAREIDFETLATRVIVRGEGEGFNQIKVSVVDTSAESQFWPAVLVYDDRSIDNETLAQNVATARISEVAVPRDQISLQTTDMYDPTWTIELGDSVGVYWPQLALSATMRVKRLQYRWGMGGETISMDLNKEARSLARAMAGTNPGIRQAVETEARHPQGATNIWQLSNADNCDPNYPLIIPFFIPEDIKKINKAKFNLRTDPIRYFSQGKGPGGGGKFYYDFFHGTGYRYPDTVGSYYYTKTFSCVTNQFSDPPAMNNMILYGEGIGYPHDGTFNAYNAYGTPVGYIVRLGLRPHSYVNCTKYSLMFKSGTTEWRPFGDWWESIETDGHYSWHIHTFYLPRKVYGEDIANKRWSWILQPYTDDPYSQWDYFWEVIDVNMELSGAGAVETGIWESAYNRLSATVYVKQGAGSYNKVWQGSVTTSSPISVTDISFKDYVTSGVWHELKVDVSDNSRVRAEVYIEAWIQSRDD